MREGEGGGEEERGGGTGRGRGGYSCINSTCIEFEFCTEMALSVIQRCSC